MYENIIYNKQPGTDMISAASILLDDDGTQIGSVLFFVGEGLCGTVAQTSHAGRIRQDSAFLHLPADRGHPLWLKARSSWGILEWGQVLEAGPAWPQKR